MRYYYVIGRTEPGADGLFYESCWALSTEEAMDAWRNAVFEYLGLSPEEADAAAEDGMAPIIEQVFVSDSQIEIA